MTEEQLTQIKIEITKALDSGATPIAAFDADGTLWPTDMGESFFEYQIQNNLIENLPSDPWTHYFDLKKKNPAEAYLWLAQINQGHSHENMLKWSKASVEHQKEIHGFKVFSFQKEIIDFLKKNSVEIYIVTASIKWAVAGGAFEYGIPYENVIGVGVRVDEQGLLTDQQQGPITFKEGKVKALLEATDQRQPFYSTGNTMGDYALLKASTNLKVTICSSAKDHKLYETEEELYQKAQENSWHTVNLRG